MPETGEQQAGNELTPNKTGLTEKTLDFLDRNKTHFVFGAMGGYLMAGEPIRAAIGFGAGTAISVFVKRMVDPKV